MPVLQTNNLRHSAAGNNSHALNTIGTSLALFKRDNSLPTRKEVPSRCAMESVVAMIDLPTMTSPA